MTTKPCKLLKVDIINANASAVWEANPEDPNDYYGYPFQWELSLNVYSQPHSDYSSVVPLSYTGLDIKVGDWIASGAFGSAWKIISISSTDYSTVTCVVEDVDRYNTFNDYTQSGNGSPNSGIAFVFEVSEDGMPLINGVEPNLLSPSFQTDLFARFFHRNASKNIPIRQASHGFVTGDLIYIDDADGMFKKAVANSAKVKNLVGVVSEVGVPHPDDFAFKPFTKVNENITPALPGTKGQLIYLHPSVPGTLTSVRPDRWAQPIYIQLDDSGTRGLMLSQGVDIVGPSGRGTSVQVVADMTARDALSVADGDQVYVVDAGEGEWALFLYKDIGGWTQISNQDSSTVDARTVSVTFDVNTTSPIEICRVSPNARVTQVTVEVLSAFSTNATLTIGDDTINNRLMDEAEIDLSTEEKFNSNTVYQYEGTTETMLKAYFTANGSAFGQAKITVSYS